MGYFNEKGWYFIAINNYSYISSLYSNIKLHLQYAYNKTILKNDFTLFFVKNDNNSNNHISLHDSDSYTNSYKIVDSSYNFETLLSNYFNYPTKNFGEFDESNWIEISNNLWDEQIIFYNFDDNDNNIYNNSNITIPNLGCWLLIKNIINNENYNKYYNLDISFYINIFPINFYNLLNKKHLNKLEFNIKKFIAYNSQHDINNININFNKLNELNIRIFNDGNSSVSDISNIFNYNSYNYNQNSNFINNNRLFILTGIVYIFVYNIYQHNLYRTQLDISRNVLLDLSNNYIFNESNLDISNNIDISYNTDHVNTDHVDSYITTLYPQLNYIINESTNAVTISESIYAGDEQVNGIITDINDLNNVFSYQSDEIIIRINESKTIKLKLQQDIDDKYFHSLKIKWNTDITYDNNITIDNVTLTNKLNYINNVTLFKGNNSIVLFAINTFNNYDYSNNTVNNELLFYSGTNNIFDLSINSDIESYLSENNQSSIELVLYEKINSTLDDNYFNSITTDNESIANIQERDEFYKTIKYTHTNIEYTYN